MPEVTEGDTERGGRGARGRRPEPDHLGLALAPVTAEREIIVEPAGVGHELRDATRQASEDDERPRERPVRAGTRLAEEMVRRPEPGRPRAGARESVLAPHGHPQA